jgi:hypothetical protein
VIGQGREARHHPCRAKCWRRRMTGARSTLSTRRYHDAAALLAVGSALDPEKYE